MEEKKNFFKKVWTSIRDFEKYEEFAADKVSNAIKYISLFTLIFTAIISLAYTYKFYLVLNDAKNYINTNIEDIKLENGKLAVSANDTILIENEENLIPIIIINTSEDANKEELLERTNMYNTGLIVLSDKVIITSNLLTQNEEIYYAEALNTNIANKEEFMNLISGNQMLYGYILFFTTVFVYMFTIYFTSNLVDGIVLGALGYLFARFVKLRLRFKATFNIGIFALTLPILLNLVYILINTFTGFTINYFQWMYTTISYIYVAVAILMIKTEIINQKIELMRLQKIQEEISKENQEEEQIEKPKKKEKENNKDKKEEKEDKEDNAGGQPAGSKA